MAAAGQVSGPAEDFDEELAAALDDEFDCEDEEEVTADEPESRPAKMQRIDVQDLAPAGPSEAKTASDTIPTTTSPLCTLPREVLIRVLAFLPADDLTSAAICSRLLRELSSEEVLWRRLYCARWGKQRSNSSTRRWKELYMLRDGEEMQTAASSAPEGMQEIFQQMQLAKRQQALGRGQVDDVMPVESRVMEQLTAWRRAKGFAAGSAQRPTDLHSREYHFHRIGASVFCCEENGWVHLCDEGCSERIVDPASDQLVCPISGRMSDRMMTEVEELQAADGDRRPAGGEEGQECGGRLAKAYLAGYNCADLRELAEVHGACLAGHYCV